VMEYFQPYTASATWAQGREWIMIEIFTLATAQAAKVLLKGKGVACPSAQGRGPL
jgi:hypothetical protein